MKEPDLRKYAQEVNEMPALPAIAVQIPPRAALAIISHIQLAIRHPGIADSEFAQIEIDVAKQLQELFEEDSETFTKCWNSAGTRKRIFSHPPKNLSTDFATNLAMNFCKTSVVAAPVTGWQNLWPVTNRFLPKLWPLALR
jgi:hypothetical protein